jgi:hypothetical protein
MTDYSRFNKILKELEQEEQQQQSTKPQINVQRFDQPMTIEIGGKNKISPSITKSTSATLTTSTTITPPTTSTTSKYTTNYSKWDNLPEDSDNEDEQQQQQREYYEDDIKREMYANQAKQEKKSTIQQVTRAHSHKNLIHNPIFSWCQTQDKVELFIKTNETNISAKQVTVELNGTILHVKLKEKILIHGQLYFGVWGDGGTLPLGMANEEDEFQKSMEWELVDDNNIIKTSTGNSASISDSSNRQRLIHITLYKRYPVRGIVAWWPRVFKQESNIEESIVDVNIDSKEKSSLKREENQRIWQEAHEAFKKKIQQSKGEKIEIEESLTTAEQEHNEELQDD